jgi:hypothetical protein
MNYFGPDASVAVTTACPQKGLVPSLEGLRDFDEFFVRLLLLQQLPVLGVPHEKSLILSRATNAANIRQ